MKEKHSRGRWILLLRIIGKRAVKLYGQCHKSLVRFLWHEVTRCIATALRWKSMKSYPPEFCQVFLTVHLYPFTGGSQDFQRRGHTVSNRGYSPDCHVDLHTLFYLMWQKKRLTKGGSQHPMTPIPPSPHISYALCNLYFWVVRGSKLVKYFARDHNTTTNHIARFQTQISGTLSI